METYLPLRLGPGFYANGTRYEAKGRWVSGNLVRWRDGALQPVGGWILARDLTGGEIDAVGFPRGSNSWLTNDAKGYIIVGTTGLDSRLYVFASGVLTDITPAGLVDGAADGSTLTGSGNFGEGGYGDGPYGGASLAGIFLDADTWSLDNFGELPIACLTSDGKLYSWDLNTANDAVQITNSPTSCQGLVVTPERFIFALGAGGDPRLVAWASQETMTTWTPSASNSAGDFPLQTNGRIVCGRRTARETLIWTDADLWGAVYVGGRFIYAFTQRGDNCGIIGPNAVCIRDGAAYWMGDGEFFRYDGAVRPLPCEVSDYVFSDFNRDQRSKVCAVPMAFGDIFWFYASASQSGKENDRYVAFHPRGNPGYWTFGTLDRAAGVGAGVFADPQLWDSNGKLYTHETGNSRGGQVPFVESGPLELGEGDRVLRVQWLIPDERTLGQVEATLYASFSPMETETVYGPYLLSVKTAVRATGRQFRIRLDESAEGEDQDWRVGAFRAGVIAGGYR